MAIQRKTKRHPSSKKKMSMASARTKHRRADRSRAAAPLSETTAKRLASLAATYDDESLTKKEWADTAAKLGKDMAVLDTQICESAKSLPSRKGRKKEAQIAGLAKSRDEIARKHEEAIERRDSARQSLKAAVADILDICRQLANGGTLSEHAAPAPAPAAATDADAGTQE